MKRIHISLIILASLTILSSCIKPVDFEFEDYQPKIVMNALLYSDSVAKVIISKSQFFLENNTSNYHGENAVLRLYVNDVAVEQLSYIDSIYIGNYTLREGDKVKIVATVPNYGDVSAQTTIPSKPEIINTEIISQQQTFFEAFGWGFFQYDSISGDTISQYNPEISPNDIYNVHYKISIRFKDDASRNNYYRIRGLDLKSSSNVSITMEDELLFPSNENASIFDIEDQNYYTVFDDQMINGKTYTLKCALEQSYYTPIQEAAISFEQISESYYWYAKTLSKYESSGSELGFNILEPIQIYCNIENGIGVVISSSPYLIKIAR